MLQSETTFHIEQPINVGHSIKILNLFDEQDMKIKYYNQNINPPPQLDY